jgi:tetratricopeptide (TPR) repeat protein
MAWQNSGWVWNVVGTQGSEYNILLFLSNEANAEGLTPLLTVEKICRRCNISRRAFFVHIKKLEAKGFVERKRKWAKGPWEANKFQLDKSRYFPRGEYQDALNLWNEILSLVPTVELKPEDRRILKNVSEVFLQKNSRTLYLVTEIDLYEDLVKENRAAFKKASRLTKFPIRRFEVFRKPYLK